MQKLFLKLRNHKYVIYLSQLMYEVIMFDFYLLIYIFIYSVIEIPVYDCSSTANEGILNICYLYFCISPLKYLFIFIFNFSDSVLFIHIVPCESQPMQLQFE